MSLPRTPLISIRPPSPAVVATFLAGQAVGGEFSYRDVGATRNNSVHPSRYNLDHNRALLGHGEHAFSAACAALRGWKMFPAPWTCITPSDAPICTGAVVAMQAQAFGLWWLNACRIVYVLDETDATGMRRFGFAYGTLDAHVEQGEERFSVELHADGAVWYDLRAFSRPRYWPVRIAKPLARRLQRRFVRESQLAMQHAVSASRSRLERGRGVPARGGNIVSSEMRSSDEDHT